MFEVLNGLTGLGRQGGGTVRASIASAYFIMREREAQKKTLDKLEKVYQDTGAVIIVSDDCSACRIIRRIYK